MQRYIASHLSSTAVATADLNYPECLTATQLSAQTDVAVSSDAQSASSTHGGGDKHVFPVLASSLAFLRRIEVALETPVFEKLVGEVCTLITLRANTSLTLAPGSAGGVWVCRFVTGCNQRAKWKNTWASVRVSLAASTSGGHAGVA